jgi:hypothetical protein
MLHLPRRSLRCFVDLLLTWNLDSKKPRGRRGVMHCSYWLFWLREEDLTYAEHQ